MIRLILVLIASILFSSCCTKKYCDQDIFPQIVVVYNGFSDLELQQMIIYVLDKESSKTIDSIKFIAHKNQFVIDKWLMNRLFDDEREFKQYYYILKTISRKDTIWDIKYERFSEKINCNSCFPIGDGSATITDYRNFEFTMNNELHANIDTVIINKSL